MRHLLLLLLPAALMAQSPAPGNPQSLPSVLLQERIWTSTDGKQFMTGPDGRLIPYKFGQQWQWEAPKAPFKNWETYAWYGSWAGLAWADWYTTKQALRRGAIETNPLLACEGPAAFLKLPGCSLGDGINMPVFLVMNLAPPVGRLIYDVWGYKRASVRQQAWNRRLRWIPQVIKGSVALWNTQQTRKGAK